MTGIRFVFGAVWAVLTILPSAGLAQYRGYNQQPDKPCITVSGDAEIKVTPDNVVIILGIETLESSMVDAKAENDKLVRSVTKALDRLGVDKSDIHTDYLNAEPKYEKWRDLGSFLGHNVKRRIVVTLKDISKFDQVISDAIEAGATRILDVRFNVDDLRKYRDQARALAIKAAAEKARDMTGEIGQTIGKAIEIQEGRTAWRSWYSSWIWSWDRNYGSAPFNVSQNTISPESDADAPLAVGKISITANVTASFLLE